MNTLHARLAAPVLVLAIAGACSPQKSSSPAPAETASNVPSPATASAPTAVQKLAGFDFAGTVAGQPAELRAAVVGKYAYSDALLLIVSTHPRACKDLEGGYALSPEETVFR